MGDASRILGALGASLWNFGCRSIYDEDSSLWLFVVVEWIVSAAVCLVMEAHNTCRFWYCPPRVLHALNTLLLHGVSGVSGVREHRLYDVCIERTNWFHVPLVQSS